jgi:hypothetical protein
LRAGNVGVVVLVYEKDAVEVEFMDGEGDTVAILTLLDKDVRVLSDHEVDAATHADPLPLGVEAPIGDATKARA